MSNYDVTAVVLTIDEPFTQRALASVERQQGALADVVVVRGIAPFHRALNEGAGRVRTPYFVQVDADMVLDPTCCVDLRACVADRVGVVIGHLRDSLLGRVAGVKLFRTDCFAYERFPDSISPDTDFGNAIARREWLTIYAIKYPAAPSCPLHVFGDHDPEYGPHYTFRKYKLFGARLRYRRAAASLLQLMRDLRASRHDVAPFALIGAAYGVCCTAENDLLQPSAPGTDFERLERFLATARDTVQPARELDSVHGLGVREAWSCGYQCGVALYRENAAAAFIATLYRVADQLVGDRGPIALVALVGLCCGIFADESDAAAPERALALLRQALPRPYRMALDPVP